MNYGLTIPQVMQVLNNSNVNVGAQTVDIGPQSAVIRGLGLIHSMDQLRDTMLTNVNGAPVLLKDIATVQVGNQPRLGIAGQDNDNDVVQGIVLMRRGAESGPTIAGVQNEVKKINESGILPPGVRIQRIYDRSDLIGVTTHTVLHNMIVGIILIFFIQWVFLGDLRSALIVATTIPFALFFAVIVMVIRGESANLLSVGAIDFGLIVDATVIMMENIFRHLSESHERRAQGHAVLHRTRRSIELRGKFATIANAAAQVNKGIFFSAAIIIAGFVPLFTMSGVEGHIFGPMAKTYAYAIAGGLIATFTVSPALASLLLPEKTSEVETVIVRFIRRLYMPVLEFALDNKIVTLGAAGVLGILALVALHGLGSEFLPHLEEGNLWIRASMPPSISLAEGENNVDRIRRIIKSYPEARTVISQHGRPDDGTDATGFFNAEFFVPLMPFDTWPKGMDKEKLTDELTKRLQAKFPGIEFNFSQYIEDNVEEAASGVKGANSVKLYGNDLEAVERTANKIKDVMATVPGVADLSVFTPRPKRPKLSVSISIGRERRAIISHRAISIRPFRPRSADRPPAISMKKAVTGISRLWCAWLPNTVRAWMRSGTSPLARLIQAAPGRSRSCLHRRGRCQVGRPEPPSSIARARNATFPSNSACATGTWAERFRTRKAGLPSRFNCRQACAWSGSASLANCRKP